MNNFVLEQNFEKNMYVFSVNAEFNEKNRLTIAPTDLTNSIKIWYPGELHRLGNYLLYLHDLQM